MARKQCCLNNKCDNATEKCLGSLAFADIGCTRWNGESGRQPTFYRSYHESISPSGKKAKDKLQRVDCTREELMDRLKKTLPSWSTHNFHKKWDYWNRTLLFEEGDKDTLIMHIDFSAVFDIIQKEAITYEIPPHAMQLVIVVSTNPSDVDGKRIWDNESWHFWGEKSDGELEYNYYF